MHKPEFPGFEPDRKVPDISDGASPKGPNKNFPQKPKSPSRPLRSATIASGASPLLSPDSVHSSVERRPTLGCGFTSRTSIDRVDWQSRSNGDNSTNEIKNYKQYHIPIRSGQSSPASSSKATPVPSPLPKPVSSDGGDPSFIGMALGSPTHPPGSVEAQWKPQVLTTITSTGYIQESNPPSGLTRSLSKRWNPFSRSKSRGPKQQGDIVSKSTESSHSSRSGSNPTIATAEENPGSRKGRINENDRKMTKNTHTAVLSRAEAHGAALSSLRPYNGGSPQPSSSMPRPLAQRGITMTTQAPPNDKPLPSKPLLSESLLDVDIPAIEMERYSVMFDKILQRQSTLPARRQVKLDNIKLPKAEDFMDSNDTPLRRPRRATSPLPKHSPSFSLFPAENSQGASIQFLSPQMRSSTSPAVVNFPTPAAFKGPGAPKNRTISVATLLRNETSAESPVTPVRRERLISKFHRKESVSEISPMQQHVDEPLKSAKTPPAKTPPAKTPPATTKPQFSTPNWKSVSTTDLAGDYTHTRNSPPRQTRRPSWESPRSASYVSDSDALDEAVEISIARQISVSHQQRRMLAPLNHPGPRRREGSATDAATRLNLGKNKRLVETKTAIPTLVNPDADVHDSSKLYRKSSRVVLEAM